MESSSNKCGVADIPKRNRSLDLKSIYESRVPRVRGAKKDCSDESDHDVGKRRKRKNRKEFPLSFFQSDAKRTRKVGVNGVKVEQGFPQKSNGKHQGFQGISLAFSESGTPFIIPKRPRGTIERKKIGFDQVRAAPKISNSSNHLEADVIDTRDEVSLGDNSVRSGTPSTTNGGISDLKTTKRFSDFNSKSKRKTDSTPPVKLTSSKEKLKQKVKVDEATGSGSDHSVSLAHDVEGEKSDRKLKPTVDPKIQVKSSRSKLNSRPNVDSSEPKEKSNGQSFSGKGEAKGHETEAKPKKRGRKRSSVKSSDSNSELKVEAKPKEVKEQNDVQPPSAPHESSLDVNNGDKSSKKRRGRIRKKSDLVIVRDSGETSKKKSEPSTGSSVSHNHSTDYLDDDDDDEENLEKNAARMLSSRFDPSCTGYSSRRRYSAFHKPGGSYFPDSSVQESFGSHAVDRDSASADDKSRALRPRREDKAKGTRRKRRHFYEILPNELDPYWVLNQRIKIFWPLDESWYYGLVDDYHSESQLHHIKYDDRDEEWVNLPEEKFKILLLPSDAPGRSKSRKRAVGDSNSKQVASKQTDGNVVTENCPDSEPIASWLSSQPQLAKSSSRALKGQRNSQEQQCLAASLSSGEAGDSDTDFLGPKQKRNEATLMSDFTGKLRTSRPAYNSLSHRSSLSGKNLVYFRKRYREIGVKGISVFEKFKACADSLMKQGSGFRWSNSNMPLWSFDECGILRLNDVMMRTGDVRFHIHLPLIPVFESSCELGASLLARYLFMLQNGIIVITSPAVLLEMIFIDNNLGLKFLMYDGCLRQALALVSLVLILFSQSKGRRDGNMGLPVSSIRFRLFSVHDLKKQHVFAFYSFSSLESAKWCYLESKISQHCLLIKQLSVSDCTVDKIKEFEYGSSQHCKTHASVLLSANEYCGPSRKLMPGFLSTGISQASCDTRMSQSAFLLAANPGKSPQFSLSFTAAPTFFQSLHMQLLMENSFSCVNLHHQDSVMSDVDEPVAECTRLYGVQDCVTKAPDSRGFPSYLKDQQMDAATAGIDISLRMQKLKSVDESQDREPRNTSVSLQKTVPVAVTSMSSDQRMESASSDMIGSSSVEKADLSFHGEASVSGQTSDVDWNLHENFVHGSNHVGFRKSGKRGRPSSLSSTLEYHSAAWPNGMPNFTANAFSNGPKKPRTQVQYSLPFVSYDISSKQKPPNSAAPPYKRIRRSRHKRISNANGNNPKMYDLLTCVANILVTQGDKGWREYGASVSLELADHNEWRLAIKHSGAPRYHYKVKHILQPGSTNRFSHAMMWKGGKDWMLEFPGRSEWMLFKEMHEECYNRNIRAASVKNIPIPGVWLVEECDDHGVDAAFIRNSARYIRQVQNDVEIAMDPSKTLYDMDSDDERWLVENDNQAVEHKYEGISEEFLEKAMDMFEKFSYAHLREDFSNSEVEELVMGLGSVEAGKIVYEHWRNKREKMGMPLIRHLQPPLWERYQQKLKEWDNAVARPSMAFSDGSHERRIPSEKPPMSAFCLKPRGLEIPNKFSKQRSHRKLPIAVSNHASSGNQDYLHGRISNGHAFIDERALHASSVHYSSDVSPHLLSSIRILSPRDVQFSSNPDASEWKGAPELSIPNNYYFGGTYTQTAKPQNSPDIHEFHLRDASSVASHARTLAKLKKHKAQRLFCKADLAIHRAVIALMAAEAMRDSAEKSDSSN